MKNSTSTTIKFIVGFIWSWFMGITAVSIGFGSIFPVMNRVAKPFVCPGGQMELNSQNYQVSPVEQGASLTWFCVDNYAETKTQLNPFIINFYAGSFYGLLIGAAGLSGYYFYKRWDPAKETEETKKRIARIQSISVIVIVVGVTLFSLMPLIRMLTYTPDPTPIPDATATSIAITYDELTSKTVSDFNSSEKPLAAWNGVPIMPKASAGQQSGKGAYSFKIPVDSGSIASYYSGKLKSLGWKQTDRRLQGMKFTKDKSVLLVALAPASDMQSWIVTFVIIP